MTDIIEKAALAAANANGYEVAELQDYPPGYLGPSEMGKTEWCNIARAVLQAIREPSEAMVGAAVAQTMGEEGGHVVVGIYEAMIDAALGEG